MNHALKHPKWAFTFSICFSIIMILGWFPWENIFSVQIRNNVLSFLTNSSFGLFGLIGFLVTLWILIDGKSRLALFIKILSGCFAILLTSIWALCLILPTFDWYDTIIYRSGSDYLIVQEQETFVTSETSNSRVIRTKSPYAAIRKIEEIYILKDNDYRFEGAEVIYNGKKWFKENADTK